MLTFSAGTLNSVGFMAVAIYTSHMTGLTASVGDHLVLGGLGVVATGAAAIVCFVVGAMTCAVVFNWGRRRALGSRFANVLLLEAAIVLTLGTFGALAHGSTAATGSMPVLPVVGVLSFTMGLQNAVITKMSGAQIRTTHVTGMITDIGIELGKLTYWHRTPDRPSVDADLGRLGLLSMLVGLFALGGVAGAAAYQWIGFAALVPVAAVLLACSARPVVHDLRTRTRTRKCRVPPPFD